MLDVAGKFIVPDVPGISVFPDDQETAGFYAFPDVPRLAQDDEGRPELSLVVYGKQNDSTSETRGAVLTMTTSLALTPDEERRLIAALTRRPFADAAPGQSPPTPKLLAPDVEEGSVEVRLIEAVVLSGATSGIGANRCTFNEKLDGERARSLEEAWRQGLPDARIAYRLLLRRGPSISSFGFDHTAWAVRTREGAETGASGGLTASASAGRQSRLTLEGPLAGPEDLERSLSRVEL